MSKEQISVVVRKAAKEGHVAIVRELLLDEEISIGYRSWVVKNASEGCHLEMIRELLSDGEIYFWNRTRIIGKAIYIEVAKELSIKDPSMMVSLQKKRAMLCGVVALGVLSSTAYFLKIEEYLC